MAEQAAADPQRHSLVVPPQRERGEQVQHDVIVVARIKRHPTLGTRGDHAAQDVECPVAIERGDLDRHDVVQRGEALPECRGEHPSAYCGLQVKPGKGHFRSDGTAMGDEFVVRSIGHRCEAQQNGVIAEASGDRRLGAGLPR